MKGLDPKYTDFPDCILGVTRHVWEERGVGTLRSCYASDIVVRSPASLIVGNENVIAATPATPVEFGPWGLRREYALFDEVAVWKQILFETGEVAETVRASFVSAAGGGGRRTRMIPARLHRPEPLR